MTPVSSPCCNLLLCLEVESHTQARVLLINVTIIITGVRAGEDPIVFLEKKNKTERTKYQTKKTSLKKERPETTYVILMASKVLYMKGAYYSTSGSWWTQELSSCDFSRY